MADASPRVPAGARLRHHLQPVGVHRGIGHRGSEHDLRSGPAGRGGRRPVSPVVARVAHSAPGDSGLAHRHVRRDAGVWILAEYPVALRSRPGDRHRRGRCDCRRGERGAKSPRGHDAAGGGASHDGRSGRGAGGHRARAVGGLRPDRVHSRHLGAVLSSVRADDRLCHRHLVPRLVDAVSRSRGAAVAASDGGVAISRRTHLREVLRRVQHRVRSHRRTSTAEAWASWCAYRRWSSRRTAGSSC